MGICDKIQASRAYKLINLNLKRQILEVEELNI